MHKEWDEGAVFAVRLFDYDTRRSTEGPKADVLSHAANVRKNTYHTHSYVHSMYIHSVEKAVHNVSLAHDKR